MVQRARWRRGTVRRDEAAARAGRTKNVPAKARPPDGRGGEVAGRARVQAGLGTARRLTATSSRNCLSSGGSSLGCRRVKRAISSPFSTSRNCERKGSAGHSRVAALGSTPLQRQGRRAQRQGRRQRRMRLQALRHPGKAARETVRHGVGRT